MRWAITEYVKEEKRISRFFRPGGGVSRNSRYGRRRETGYGRVPGPRGGSWGCGTDPSLFPWRNRPSSASEARESHSVLLPREPFYSLALLICLSISLSLLSLPVLRQIIHRSDSQYHKAHMDEDKSRGTKRQKTMEVLQANLKDQCRDVIRPPCSLTEPSQKVQVRIVQLRRKFLEEGCLRIERNLYLRG